MIPLRKVKRAFTGRLVGFPHDPPEHAATSVVPPKPVLSEEAVRAKFGVKTPSPATPKFAQSMRQTLMLHPEDLIALFDESPATKISEREDFVQVDFLVPVEMLQHRVERLKKLIAASKSIVEGLSVRVMKARRGKDEVLDKPTRERYKRHENARITCCNAKLFRYRQAIRAGNYHERVWRWQTQPVYFRDVVDDVMTFKDFGETYYVLGKPAMFEGTWHDTHDLVRDYIESGIHDTSRYEVVMRLDSNALELLGATEEQQQRAWRNWQRWENAVIKAAVFHGVIRPRQDLLELLGLMPFVKQAVSADDNPIEADEMEDALALKTGGACYGGTIKGNGYRYNSGSGTFRRRSLESFTREGPPKDKDLEGTGWADVGFTSLNNPHDDAESYDPR
jgi:hypothetical protein